MATRARILADYVSSGVTAAEFDFLDGVTSNVQTQMDLKAPLASPTFTGTVAIPNVANLETAVVANTAKVSGSTNASDLASGTLAVARMASGTTLQTKGDAYTNSGSTLVSTSSVRLLSTNLEVPITCNNTANFLRISFFIPDFSNKGFSARSLKVGFRYSTDSFSSSDVQLGDSEWINKYAGYLNTAVLHDGSIHTETWEQVPVAGSEIKIQTALQSIGGDVDVGSNTIVTFSLIVSEIKA